MCALESGEGRYKFSGVSIGFSLSETRDGWMGLCGYYRFISQSQGHSPQQTFQ